MRRGLRARSALLAAGVALCGLFGTATAGDRNGWNYPYFPERLMPENGAPIQADGKLTGTGNEDAITGSAMGRAPLYQAPDWYLMLQGDGYVSWFDGGDEQVWGGDVGLILRGAFDANNSWGVNAFVDLGSQGAFAGQGSVGLEYEYVSDGGMSLRAGGNAYVPFRDYGRDEAFLRAPRLGGDLYAGIGQDIRWHRLELFVSGFHYLETDEVEGLSGALVEGEYRYSGFDFLPPGSHLYVAAGVGWDSLDHDLNPQVRVGLAFPFSNDGSKDRVAEIKRNLGYGTAFVPLQRKAKKTGGGDPVSDCGEGVPPSDLFVDILVSANDGGQFQNVPAGVPFNSFIPQSTIDAACAPYDQCATMIGAYDGGFGFNSGGAVHYFKDAGSCEARVFFAGE